MKQQIGRFEVGDDVIVGAGAVVTKSFPKGSVVEGVPAALVSRRDQKHTTTDEGSKVNL